jgi:hypothetical protein
MRLSKVGDIIEPLVRRVFRQPGREDEVVLSADLIEGPGGADWWRVALAGAADAPSTVARLRGIIWYATYAEARQGFALRQRALRAAGYERVD